MSWGLLAAGLGLVGSLVSSRSSSKASNRVTASNNRELELRERQYADFEATYGGIRENLTEYYTNLTPQSYAAKRVDTLLQAYDATHKEIAQAQAIRNTTSEAVAVEDDKLALSLASQRAGIRANATQAVADAKQRYLTPTSQLGNSALDGLAGAYRGAYRDEEEQRRRRAQERLNQWQQAGQLASSDSFRAGVADLFGKGG